MKEDFAENIFIVYFVFFYFRKIGVGLTCSGTINYIRLPLSNFSV